MPRISKVFILSRCISLRKVLMSVHQNISINEKQLDTETTRLEDILSGSRNVFLKVYCWLICRQLRSPGR